MNKKKFRFWLVFTILWLIVIFGHSAMPSEVSRQESLGILAWLTKLLPNLSHSLLRKLGHIAEFSILGILVVAFLDETLQLFVSGRSGEVRDIWIDLIGIFCGTLFLWIIFKIRKK